MEPVIVFISLFASVFGIVYLYFTTRNKERMALIENGADASLFYSARSDDKKKSSFWILKIGIFLIGIASGILMGSLLDEFTQMQEEVAYFSMIFLFGGISLVVYYIVEQKLKDKESK